MEGFTRKLSSMIDVCSDFFLCEEMLEDTSTERIEEIYKLIGDREDFTSYRMFHYYLPEELNKNEFYVEYFRIALFDNGTALALREQGNKEFNTSDHRLGVFEESEEKIVVKTISVWECNGHTQFTYVFNKNSDGTLYFNDTYFEVHGTEGFQVTDKTLIKMNKH